jgi:hypothetical protein
MIRSAVRAACLGGLAAVTFASCGPSKETFAPEVVAVRRAALPEDPADPAWKAAPVHRAPLILQDLVEPRLLEPSTREVLVRAITDGARIAFRLEWDDPSQDDTQAPGRFTDACAIQLPTRVSPDLPAPQMGEPGRPVEITYWRAAWQAVVDGRGDSIRDLYPGAGVDHYPFEAASLEPGSAEQTAMAMRYAPARAVGNAMAGPRTRPVEDLVAEGPATVAPAPAQFSKGRGRRLPHGWAVVLSRPLPGGLGPGARTEVAFAVWQGGHGEAGARKMRSVWIPLSMEASR